MDTPSTSVIHIIHGIIGSRTVAPRSIRGEGELMDAAHSLGEILAKLEEQIAFHREREAAAARQEAVYRNLRTAHGAELEVLTQNLAELKAAAATALELAGRPHRCCSIGAA
jgi:hypothetical protein